MNKSKLLAKSFLDSAVTTSNQFQDLDETLHWLGDLQANPHYKMNQIPFDQLDSWYLEKNTSNIKHRSGKFFSIEGVHCKPCYNAPAWEQPIIHQPEIGLLGIVTKVFNNTRYFLMQAKMEPGNINRFQLSPTLQATYSNYTQVHKGKLPPYLDLFLDNSGSQVVEDRLQSETGTRFFQKFNRNIILDIDTDVEPRSDFRWLTLGEIQMCMGMDDLINMDARSVLSNINFGDDTSLTNDPSSFLQSKLCDGSGSINSMEDLLHWLESVRGQYRIEISRRPLNAVKDWAFDEWGMTNTRENFFSIIAVEIEASEREVSRWSQPILKHEGLGIAGFICQRINGVLHFLIQAKPEPGIVDSVELGPTVSVFDYENRGTGVNLAPYLERFLDPPENWVRYSAIQSEEGGRFLNLRNRFMVLEVAESEKIHVFDRYNWMTLRQLYLFSRGEGKVNSEARTLLACLNGCI